ncbi:MAG: ABC transporter ATP-binding protein [Elusimicrobia bacterium]|nr:ABC transporter ATP-binding protein [Elusimicrobiota bacterium]
MSGAALEVRGLGKLFHHTLPRYRTMVGRLRRWADGGPSGLPVWALKDVSFEVARGECLGVMGPNGSGKSTLLALIAGILEPTEGAIRARGRVNTLLNLGAGLQQELSVRDNVEIFGILTGLSRRRALELTPRILDFAGVEPLAEVRMAELSSGQAARVAFSTAMHSDLDLLLVDETLSVGDSQFQAKCEGEFQRLRREGRTLIVVSHDEPALRAVATRILRLESGRVAGEPERIAAEAVSRG